MNKYERSIIVKSGLEAKNTLDTYKTVIVKELSEVLNALHTLDFSIYDAEDESIVLDDVFEEDGKIYFMTKRD